MYRFFRHPVYIFSTKTTVVLFYFFYMVFYDKGLYLPHRDLPIMNFNEHPTPSFLKSYIQRSVMQWSEASRAHEVVSSFKRRPCFVGKEREAISFHSDLWSTDQPSAPSLPTIPGTAVPVSVLKVSVLKGFSEKVLAGSKKRKAPIDSTWCLCKRREIGNDWMMLV